MANAVVIVAVPERRPKLVVTFRYKCTAIAELTGVVPVQNLAVGAGRVLRLHNQETELAGKIVLVAFLVGVETACAGVAEGERSEEHTSELQSRPHLVCRLLLEKKKKKQE